MNVFTSPKAIEPGPEAATSWPRVRLVLLLAAICFLAHFNRVSMAVAGDEQIMRQYGISPEAMGTIYSAFLVAYTLLMIPGGWLIDRYGPRRALALVCFGSAAFVVLTGSVGWIAVSGASAWWALVVIRSLMGSTSVPLHPASAKAVSLGIPPSRRSAANGLVTGAALLGVASTYTLFGWLIDRFDWPGAFVVAGLATAAVGWAWSVYGFQESQVIVADHPRPFDQVQIVVHHETPPVARRSRLGLNKNLWLLTASYAAVGYFQYLFFYWMHYYFETVLRLGSQESRLYASIPPLAMAVAMPLGGWLSDRLETKFSWRAGRSGLVTTAMVTSALLLLAGTLATQPFWIVTWLSLALGVLGMAEGPFWVTAVEVGGRGGGFSAGIFNTGGNLGGVLAPVLTPWVSETLGFGWQAGIGLGSAVCLAGAAMWRWIDLEPAGGERTDALPADAIGQPTFPADPL